MNDLTWRMVGHSEFDNDPKTTGIGVLFQRIQAQSKPCAHL